MKLHAHYQRIPDWARNLATSWAKVVNPPEVNPFPASTRVIGRAYMPESEEATYIMRGADGGRDYFHHWQEYYSKRPWVHAWEGTNEFIPDTADKCKRLDEFTSEWATQIERIGLRSVGLNLSVGWPKPEHIPLFSGAVRVCRYIGLHEYAAPRMQDGGGHWTLRYRAFAEPWLCKPRILITECGIDGGCIGQARKGWRDYCSEEEYWQQLQWYDSELAKDDYVQAAFVFTAGPEREWTRFEVTENLARRIWAGHHFEQRLAEVAQVHIIPHNPVTSFYRKGREMGWELASGEFDFEGHRAQVWFDAEEGRQKIQYARIGDWANIKVIDRAN